MSLTHEEMKREMSRRKSQRMRLLEAFRKEGELTTKEIIRLTGSGVSSRIHELRDDGYKIVTVHDGDHKYRYVFSDKPEKPIMHWKQHKMRNIEDVSL